MTLSDLEDRFSCLKPFWLLYLAKYSTHLFTIYLYNAWIGKRTWPVISTVVSKMRAFSRSQAVTYTVEVVISRKRCTTETLLPQTANMK